MSKPKILHTMTWLAKGGSVNNNVLLSIQNMQDDYEFHLAVGGEIHHNPFKEVESLKVHICDNLVRSISPINDLITLWYLIKLIKKHKFDIVHTHGAKASFISRIAAFIAGCPCIIYGLHGVNFNSPFDKLGRTVHIMLEKLTIWMNHFIIAVTHDAMTKYHEKNIGKSVPFEIVYSGIDIDRFTSRTYCSNKEIIRSELGFTKDDFIITNIGRFSEAKAQKYTIESFARISKKHPHTKLLLVGDGPLLEACKQQVKSLKIEDRVVFQGFSSDVEKYLMISNLFVLTSLQEGLPRIVVEASLVKIPTVSFDIEGIHEILEDGKSGYIVPRYDIEELTNKISKLITNEIKRNTFAKKSYIRAKKNWDYKTMVKKHHEIYRHLLNNEESTIDKNPKAQRYSA